VSRLAARTSACHLRWMRAQAPYRKHAGICRVVSSFLGSTVPYLLCACCALWQESHRLFKLEECHLQRENGRADAISNGRRLEWSEGKRFDSVAI
jgi:hypothetical protein